MICLHFILVGMMAWEITSSARIISMEITLDVISVFPSKIPHMCIQLSVFWSETTRRKLGLSVQTEIQQQLVGLKDYVTLQRVLGLNISQRKGNGICFDYVLFSAKRNSWFNLTRIHPGYISVCILTRTLCNVHKLCMNTQDSLVIGWSSYPD